MIYINEISKEKQENNYRNKIQREEEWKKSVMKQKLTQEISKL